MWRAFVAFLLLTGCDPVTEHLEIRNPTNQPVYYVMSQKNDLSDHIDPATPVKLSYKNHIKMILPNSTITELRHGNDALSYFIKQSDNGRLNIAVFNIDTLKHYNWNTIIAQKTFSRKYDYSLQELDSLSWKIELK